MTYAFKSHLISTLHVLYIYSLFPVQVQTSRMKTIVAVPYNFESFIQKSEIDKITLVF